MPKSIRILLADDHHLVRAGIRALLDRISGVTVVGEAQEGVEALELVRTVRPDIVLADIAMPGLNGIALAERLAAEAPGVRIIILSMHASDAHIAHALQAGAAGYLIKGGSVIELELAIKSVAEGGTYLTPAIAGKVVDTYVRGGGKPQSLLQRLTPRQRQILELIAQGCSAKEAAHRLDISVKTVETHRSELMQRLNIYDVATLVKYAIENGLV
jgi:DNA-binding NarL/FixJ family response regulator